METLPLPLEPPIEDVDVDVDMDGADTTHQSVGVGVGVDVACQTSAHPDVGTGESAHRLEGGAAVEAAVEHTAEDQQHFRVSYTRSGPCCARLFSFRLY